MVQIDLYLRFTKPSSPCLMWHSRCRIAWIAPLFPRLLNSLQQLIQLPYLLVCPITKGNKSPRQHDEFQTERGKHAVVSQTETTYRSFSQSYSDPISRQPRPRLRPSVHTTATPSRSQSMQCVSPYVSPFPFSPTTDHGELTRCAGFSTLRCARNSAFTYSSPNNRICGGRCLRWARKRRRYKGMGGRRGR